MKQFLFQQQVIFFLRDVIDERPFQFLVNVKFISLKNCKDSPHCIAFFKGYIG